MRFNINYKTKCPHLIKVTRERWVEKEKWTEEIPCGATSYIVLEKGIFTSSSGFDPLGIKVKCKNCGNIYYLFPTLQ